MDPRYVRSRRFGLQTFRCITSAFLHGSLFHLGMNMWNLNRVGHMIEGLGLKNGGARGGSGGRQQSSAKGMLLLGGTYLLSAVAGSYAHLKYKPFTPALGASGAIMGLYGFLFIFFKRSGAEAAAQSVLRYMFSLICFGLYASNVANEAHVGGFLGGAAVCLVSGPRVVKKRTKTRTSLDL